jgi:Zn-finger nucleic acid-binding protein
MKCPHCPDVTLVMADRQGVEIDYCPQCRGVWLDRGELDKLIERAAGPGAPAGYAQQPGYPQGQQPGYPQAQQPGYPPAGHGQPYPQQHQRRPDFVDSDFHEKQYKRKKSWLSDIFD